MVADKRKALKQIMWPELDSDALPSSYCVRILQTLGKWKAKLMSLETSLEPFVGKGKNGMDETSSEGKLLGIELASDVFKSTHILPRPLGGSRQ